MLINPANHLTLTGNIVKPVTFKKNSENVEFVFITLGIPRIEPGFDKRLGTDVIVVESRLSNPKFIKIAKSLVVGDTISVCGQIAGFMYKQEHHQIISINENINIINKAEAVSDDAPL